MRIDEILDAFKAEGRNLAWQGESIESLPNVTRRARAGGAEHEIRAFRLDANNADEVIRSELAHYRRLGRPLEWKVFSYDDPPDLLSRLQSAGFAVGPLEKVVIYPLDRGLAPFQDDFSCNVRRVERPEQLADFRRVAEAVFSKDYSLTTGQLAEALVKGRSGHDAYIAYVDATPVGIGRLYTDPASAFAGLYGGGTLPEFRGRGSYRAILAARARDALSRGARYLQVDALPTSLPILLRLGFIPIADTWACTWAPTLRR